MIASAAVVFGISNALRKGGEIAPGGAKCYSECITSAINPKYHSNPCYHLYKYPTTQWPISETITCNARDVIWRTDYGGKKRLVFMDAEDSSEGLVKAATRKKVYKCLEVC